MKIADSTLSTWWSPRNLEKVKKIPVDRINATDVKYNPKQRPDILVDTEKILVRKVISANDLLSESFSVALGIPQGTVLGPILFIIMICDLGKDLLISVTSKYADDTKNTAKIGNTDDSKNFQEELDEVVYPWAPNNNMCLNGEKFEHHRIGDNLGVEKYSYKDPNGNVIMEKEYIKDLGVYISNDLTWTRQIDEVVSRARTMSG